MRLDLKSELSKWRNDENKIGIRKVNYSSFPGIEDEYLITLSEELNVSLNNQTRNITVIKRFQTFAQANNGRIPNGDVLKAAQMCRLVSDDFNEKYDTAINEMFVDYNGEIQELE